MKLKFLIFLFEGEWGNQMIRFKIFGLLLIDARQIYGSDYQLLAASHNQIELDSRTGRITERNNPQFHHNHKTAHHDASAFMQSKPLINIDLIIATNKLKQTTNEPLNKNKKEYILNSTFSMLDVILNPETISELIMLFYVSYLNINDTTKKSSSVPSSSTINKKQETTVAIDLQMNNQKKSADINSNRIKINFEFSRLSVLIFRIENFERAKKIALFELNGANIEANVLPEIDHFEVSSKLKGLKVSDLNQISKKKMKNNRSIFGIGLQNENILADSPLASTSSATPETSTIIDENSAASQVFKVVYKKSRTNHNSTTCVSQLDIQMASLCYLHSAEFIYELQCCLNDFMYYHAKVMKNLSDQATNLALNMIKKGLY